LTDDTAVSDNVDVGPRERRYGQRRKTMQSSPPIEAEIVVPIRSAGPSR
jgi:hypothetical protein